MYLLKHVELMKVWTNTENSHSTMYLLKQAYGGALSEFCVLFTFHHVSIKTACIPLSPQSQIHSHSTMYLLKPYRANYSVIDEYDSHSTMYLLKPR